MQDSYPYATNSNFVIHLLSFIYCVPVYKNNVYRLEIIDR